MTRSERALCVSTSTQTRGGIATYVRMMQDTELWSRWQMRQIVTHRDGSAAAKILAFASGFGRFTVELLVRRPDVVHLHMSSYGSFVRKALMFWTARVVGVPSIVHVHGSEFDVFHDRLPPPLQAVVRATFTHASAVVALGDRWAARLAVIAPAAHVTTVPNGVRVPGLPVDAREGGLHVVFLGEIGERKGAFTLVEAWAKLAAEPHLLADAHLTLAGDRGGDRATALAVARDVADSVEVRSWLSPAGVDDLLAGADVFVLPSRSEGQPMALLEAMAHGMCVIATDVGGIPEMIDDGRSGLLIPPDDVEALGAALRRVLGDADLRSALGRAARERVLADFDLDVVWRRFDALYRDASRA
ncbi:glycosyltransferase family 4 protein [Pseudonocardia sp. GCM10023141]|uniref:glycosyltransferase family 4 protein n=1 Tax=Pseudonocardia sp. GCM10023141 TaxID=3252653 RepID=UPI0036199F05